MFDKRERSGVLLKMRAPGPPLMMNNLNAWQIQFIQGDSSNGDYRTVALAARELVSGRQPRRGPLFPCNIHSCDIPSLSTGSIFPAMRSLQKGVMQAIQQVTRAADGAQQVLRLDGGMLFA